MIFWIAAAFLAGAVAALILFKAAQAGRRDVGALADPASVIYQRQLGELEELAHRGVIDEADRRSAFAEAARRLLSVAPAAEQSETHRTPAWAVLAAIMVTALAALMLYWISGNPGAGDQPFAARLAAWRSSSPQTLTSAQMAAVLKSIARERPDDVRLQVLLAKAQLDAGAPADAAIALRRAATLAPGDTSIQALLGQALVAATQDESVPAEAEAAFRRAAAADPADLSSRYFLGLAQVTRGETGQGIAAWQALRDLLAADDPRRAVLDAKIAEAANTAAESSTEADMIAGMVSRLADRLRSQPDDPEGWARLVHAYAVLGDREARQQATIDARKALAGQPDSLAQFEQALKSSR